MEEWKILSTLEAISQILLSGNNLLHCNAQTSSLYMYIILISYFLVLVFAWKLWRDIALTYCNLLLSIVYVIQT